MTQNSRQSKRNRHAAGSHVRWFAERMGWPIAQNNIIVEGNDGSYFQIAARLYKECHGLELLSGLSIFPIGEGNEGGTQGILRHFASLQDLINEDLDEHGNRMFRAIVLFDSDPAGKYACKGLTAKHTNFKENRDVFLLKRRLPRKTREPNELAKLIEAKNEPWKTLDCEIEDLLSKDFLDAFISETPQALKHGSACINGGHHFEFADGVKPQLLRYTNQYAMLMDMELVVDALKSLRYYLYLEPDGNSIK